MKSQSNSIILLHYFKKTNLNECGTDEAGRGCLAGPVTNVTIIRPGNFRNELINKIF